MVQLSEYPSPAVLRNPMIPRLWSITRKKPETYDTFTIELEPRERGEGLAFAPGQFNMLYAFGVGEIPISISGDPAQPKRLTHTLRVVGAVTWNIKQLPVGGVIGVRGPYGTPWPVESAVGSDIVIVAGGIGLAPLRPALFRLLAQREKYGSISFFYGTRTPEDILFQKELEQWRARFDLHVSIMVDRATESWRGNVGVVTSRISRGGFDPSNTVALVCGPEVMMRFAATELLKRGVQPESIFLSMERNMKCGVGLCGHCQFGPTFVCKDGPIFPYNRITGLLGKREV